MSEFTLIGLMFIGAVMVVLGVLAIYRDSIVIKLFALMAIPPIMAGFLRITTMVLESIPDADINTSVRDSIITNLDALYSIAVSGVIAGTAFGIVLLLFFSWTVYRKVTGRTGTAFRRSAVNRRRFV